MSSRRSINLVGFLGCAGVLAFAYFLQIAEGLEVCPLCVFQRVSFVAVGMVFLVAAIHDPGKAGAQAYGLAIMVTAGVGPAIAGGNSVIVKPATVTPLSAIKLGECLLEAGLPSPIISVVTGYGSKLGDSLVSDPRVRMISFTGGVEAGEHISRIAGLKKLGMELGSNSPVIVLPDCKLDAAVESCVSGAFWAVGQNCIGVQRIYIQQEVYESFREKFVSRTKQYKTGSQLDENTDMGPMITEEEAKRVEEWVQEALSQGAKLLTGGERNGTLIPPTVLENVSNGVRLDCEEIFGPVVCLYSITNLKEAIEKSNAVDYGLHGAIFTNEISNAFYAIQHMEVGGIIINDSTDYRVDHMPFGGIKKSGLGREGIRFALQEMTEPKVVCFNL